MFVLQNKRKKRKFPKKIYKKDDLFSVITLINKHTKSEAYRFGWYFRPIMSHKKMRPR
jgi:hypothetical protein